MKINRFKGMNIVAQSEGSLQEPTTILNAFTGENGTLKKREGSTQVISLPGSHSLWTNNKGLVLCMAEGSLYRVIDKKQVEFLTSSGKADAPVCYIEISKLIYLSNKYWCCIYDPATNQCIPWGTDIPNAPVLSVCDGSLAAGVYSVCVTIMGYQNRISGNSNISTITLFEKGGINIDNLPADCSVWLTDPDGSQFYYAGSGQDITTIPDYSEPLPSLWGSPPKPLTSITWAFGKVWGGNKNRLYYSEPYQPELFNLSKNFFEFDEEVLLIAKTEGGLYIGCKSKTYFLAGRTPEEMVEKTALDKGVVVGSLCYASELPQLGKNVPVWIGKGGIYAGTQEGSIKNLIKDKIKLNPKDNAGASMYMVKNGQTRMMFSYKEKGTGSQNIGFGDNASCEIVRNGSVI